MPRAKPAKGEFPAKMTGNPKNIQEIAACVAEDDDEDGDIATPKRDRYGEDDQPL